MKESSNEQRCFFGEIRFLNFNLKDLNYVGNNGEVDNEEIHGVGVTD